MLESISSHLAVQLLENKNAFSALQDKVNRVQDFHEGPTSLLSLQSEIFTFNKNALFTIAFQIMLFTSQNYLKVK